MNAKVPVHAAMGQESATVQHQQVRSLMRQTHTASGKCMGWLRSTIAYVHL